MKKHIILYSLILLIMLITPVIAVRPKNKGGAMSFDMPKRSVAVSSTVNRVDNKAVFIMLDESTGKIIKTSDRDFVYGAVITEMPPTFSPEALKAQAVASYTFFCKKRREQRAKPQKELKGADFVVNTKDWHYYVSKQQMQERWGKNFEKNYSKLTRAVDSVYGEVLENDGELILAAYHAISGGKTEKSRDVFGGDLSYLTSVPSPGDLFAPNYCTKSEFSKEKIKGIILSKSPSAKIEDNPEKWLGAIKRTPSGMVKTITLGGVEFKGLELRKYLGLRSADFDVTYKDGHFEVTVRGYGHGVGMSQYGAEYMAKQGSDYKQILSWYYPNTDVIKY